MTFMTVPLMSHSASANDFFALPAAMPTCTRLIFVPAPAGISGARNRRACGESLAGSAGADWSVRLTAGSSMFCSTWNHR
jgi:hypothetical protein